MIQPSDITTLAAHRNTLFRLIRMAQVGLGFDLKCNEGGITVELPPCYDEGYRTITVHVRSYCVCEGRTESFSAPTLAAALEKMGTWLESREAYLKKLMGAA